MPEQSYIRSAIALAAVQLLPPTVREGLITDTTFREEFGLAAEAILTLGASNADFQRSALFEAVRSALNGAPETSVDDKLGRSWRVEFNNEEAQPTVRLSHGSQELVGNHLVLLSPDPEKRLGVFRAEAHRVNLPAASWDRWQSPLASRAPDDDELVSILDEINSTPTARQASIAEHLSHGRASLDLLVPRSAEYFERLVGRHEEGQTFEDFLARVATPHLQALISWKPLEGYKLALMLASHASFAAGLGALDIGAPDLIRLQNWLAHEGDPLSQAAEIEVSLGRVQSVPEIKESLERVIDAFSAGPSETPTDSYKVLSALIMLIDGQLAVTRLLASRPPYWRRLAAIAQATLVLRAALSIGAISPDFVQWVHNTRAQFFVLQCYVDMRLEPRWIPEFVLPRQLWNELGGRVLSAAYLHRNVVTEVGWAGRLGSEPESRLKKKLDLPQAFMPGPLEGGTQATLEFDANDVAKVRAELSQPTVTATSFMALANSPFLRRIPDELCNLAADALARANYRIDGANEETPLVPLLLALANVASAARSHRLADALFIVLRVYRRLYVEELDTEEAFRITMIASASRADLSEWCKCVGAAMNDLAFQTITMDQAGRLHSHLVNLCHLVPELWATCGQAEAALRAVLNA